MKYLRRLLSAAALALTLVGCEQPLEPTDPVGAAHTGPARLSQASSQDAMTTVAGIVADGLSDAKVRRALIQVMRGSPYVEYKVRFRDFLDTRAGERMLASAERSNEGARDLLADALGDLPALDFYVATDKARSTWTGRTGATVVGSVDQKAWVGRRPGGSAVIGLDPSELGGEAVILAVHPAERRFYRLGRRAGPTPGDVIQDPGDGRGGLAVSITDEWGQRTVDLGRDGLTLSQALQSLDHTEGTVSSLGEEPCDPELEECCESEEMFTALTEECDPSEGPGDPGPAPPQWGTYTDFLQSWVEDGIGRAEVEVKFWLSNDSIHGLSSPPAITFAFGSVEAGDVLIDERGCPTFEPSFYPGCLDTEQTVWSNAAPGTQGNVLLMQLWEIDGNGLDDQFGDEIVGFTTGEALVNFNSPFTGDCQRPLTGENWICGQIKVFFDER